MTDRHAQPHLPGLEARRALVGFEGVLLAHEPYRHLRDRDPGLRIVRLDLRHVPRGRVGLVEAAEREQRRGETAPRERQMRGLAERVAQQPLGIRGHVSLE